MHTGRLFVIASLFLLSLSSRVIAGPESADYTLVEALDSSDTEGSWVSADSVNLAPLSGTFAVVDQGRVPINRLFSVNLLRVELHGSPFEIAGNGGYLYGSTLDAVTLFAGMNGEIDGQSVSLSGSGPRNSQAVPPIVVDVALESEGYRMHLVAVRDDRCPGDCNGDFRVSVDELISSVVISLSPEAYRTCIPADAELDRRVTVDDLVRAIGNALHGCME